MKCNRDRFLGFLTGVLATTLVLGLGASALAAGRSILIDDGITVTINGARFSPKSANGAEAPLFVHDGTTYAPVRALCEAAGLTVDYDAARHTACIITEDMALAADPNAASYLSVDRARELALRHAGVSAADAVFFQTKLDREAGKSCYDVEFYCGNTEYDYSIDAVTGAVLQFDHELEHYDIHYDRHTAPDAAVSDLITAAEAKSIALAQAPGGARVIKCELDRDDGRYVYELELQTGRAKYECDINAVTGLILKWETDHH